MTDRVTREKREEPRAGQLWVRNSHSKRGRRVRIQDSTQEHVYFAWIKDEPPTRDRRERETFLRMFDPLPEAEKP